MNEDGSEHLYYTDINQPIVELRRLGARVDARARSIDPFVLGSKDENDVQGYAGIPDRRERAHLRRERRRRRRRRAVPAPAALLRRRRLARRSVHEQVAEGQVPPQLVGRRPDAAVRAPAHDARHRGPPADRRPGRRLGRPASIRSRSSSTTRTRWSAPRPTTRPPGSSSSAFRRPRRSSRPGKTTRSSRPPTTRRRRTSTRSATSIYPNTNFKRVEADAS